MQAFWRIQNFRIFSSKFEHLEFCFDVNLRIWTHHQNKNFWDITYRRSGSIFKFKSKSSKLRILVHSECCPHMGGVCEILEYSKYSEYRLWPKISQMQELTMILSWEDELGSNETNFPPISFLPTNLAFQTRTYISNFPNSLDIEHFLTASTRYWSISNILQEIDCSSKIKVWTSIDPWQYLSPVRSKSWSEVEKLDSHAGLDCVLTYQKIHH